MNMRMEFNAYQLQIIIRERCGKVVMAADL